MGTQQILLVVLGILMIGIAIAVGIAMFSPTLAESNKMAIVNDMMNLSQYAYRYKLKPIPFGGGGKTYTGFTVPDKLSENEDAYYSSTATATTVSFTGLSKLGFGSVTAVLDSTGQLGTFGFTGGW